jgi:hypothetical protein
MSPKTISKGIQEFCLELDQDIIDLAAKGRCRKEGTGRKPITEKEPDLIPTLLELIKPATSGHPESKLKWVSKSLRQLSDDLGEEGIEVSHSTVGSILKKQGV